MVKVKYRGPKLFEPEMKDLKETIHDLKREMKGLKCAVHHRDSESVIHLRFVKETGELEKHVNACCYEFENVLKDRLAELRIYRDQTA